MILTPQFLSFQQIYDMYVCIYIYILYIHIYIYIHTIFLGIAKIAVNGGARQDNLMTHLSSGPVASMTLDQKSSSC